MQAEHPLTARVEMLIRRPVAEVFEAFVDPAITTKFWFSKSSGRLEPGKTVTWEWEVYGFSIQVSVKAVENDARILIEWSDPSTTVEWTFSARPDETTFVSIANWGFSGTERQIAEQAVGSAEGFSFVLAGLKALLEHDILLNLVPDRFPDGLPHDA